MRRLRRWGAPSRVVSRRRCNVRPELAACRKRVLRLLRRRGIHLGTDDIDEPAEEAPELAAALRSSVLDRERSPRRRGEPQRTRPHRPPRRLAHLDGFSLHADTLISANDHSRR